MCALDDSLEALVRSGAVEAKKAFLYAQSKSRFEKLFSGEVELATRRREVALR
jgi:hypothetical protein